MCQGENNPLGHSKLEAQQITKLAVALKSPKKPSLLCLQFRIKLGNCSFWFSKCLLPSQIWAMGPCGVKTRVFCRAALKRTVPSPKPLLCLALQPAVHQKFLSRIQISTRKSWPVMWELENIHLFCRVHWEITCSCVGNPGVLSLILLSQCFPNPFFFLMPKYVTIPLLHSGLTETIQKYFWACWMCADAGVGSETLDAVTSY